MKEGWCFRMDNGSDNMIVMYLFETNSLLEELDGILINSEISKEFTEEDINEIFRIMHTIKGSSAMMEFDSLMKISHKIEDLFFYIRENGMDKFDKGALFDLMFKSNDFLKAEVQKIENGEPLEEDVASFENEINKMLNSEGNETQNSKSEGKAEIKANEINVNFKPEGAPYIIEAYFKEETEMKNLRAFMLVTSIKELIGDFLYYPEDIETDSSLSEKIAVEGFYMAFKTENELNLATEVIKNSLYIERFDTYEVEKETEKEDDKNKANESPTGSKSTQKQSKPQNQNVTKQNLINVSLSKLDKLLDIVGEIVITEAMVTSSPEIASLKLDNFNKSARQLRKLTDELQEVVMSVRMVPVSGVFHKMNRIVRDMGQALNKNVKLTLVGENTEVDKAIVDAIQDPIMHVVRNAMDHGLENKDERKGTDKSEQGEIILSARHAGGEVIISVQDDGKGIDSEIVLRKAREKGLLTKDVSEYSEKEAVNFIMHPGFSTNSEVTEFSGRGVGMDVVRENIETIGGRIYLNTEKGKGTTVTFNIPLTLAIIEGMQIRVGKSIFTIPISNIKQSFKVEADEVVYGANGEEMINKMEKFYQIARLHNIYSIDTEVTEIPKGVLIWVESHEKTYCIFADELIGEQQVVVKPLPNYLNAFTIKDYGISGCTILGNGDISLILDVLNFYNQGTTDKF